MMIRATVFGLFMSATTAAFAAQTDAPKLPATAVNVETIASGLEQPWGMQFLPNGGYLVTEKDGRLRVVSKDGKLSEPVNGVPEVAADGQGGLLDVLLSPDYATSGIIYFSYGEPRDGFRNGTSVARAKLTLTNTGGKLDDLQVIFRQEPATQSEYHFGSRLVWDKTGALFVTLGERNSLRLESQNPANHIGKVVRILPDGSVPEDNPKIEGWDPKVWSIGHRNVQGAVLNPETGELWATEHGAQGGDELNRVEKGKNYGWPVITWGENYGGGKIGEGTAKEGLEQPVYYWVPSIATSGLAIYTADLFPGWKGNVLAGGLRGAVLERLVLTDGQVTGVERLLTDLSERIRDVRQGPDGAVYVLTDSVDGKILRLSPKS